MARTRTTVVLEQDHVDAIRQRYGVRTTAEAVDLALRLLAERAATLEEALAMQGTHAIGEVPEDVGPRGATPRPG